MTQNELVDKMAKRAKELADMPMNSLRTFYPETTETQTELIRLCKEAKYTRGDMVRDVLIEEFLEEFDRNYEDT